MSLGEMSNYINVSSGCVTSVNQVRPFKGKYINFDCLMLFNHNTFDSRMLFLLLRTVLYRVHMYLLLNPTVPTARQINVT